MENFNVHLSLTAPECTFDDKKIKFSKKLPRPLSLDNYEVSLVEFTSTSLNDSESYICIKNFINKDVSITDMPKTILVPVNLEIESEEIINENIQIFLASYLYYFIEHLFYNPDEIKVYGLANNQICFIINKNETIVACNPNFYNKYLDRWFKNFESNVIKIKNSEALELENQIRNYDRLFGQTFGAFTSEHIEITTIKTFESQNPDVYKKKFHELLGGDLHQIVKEFQENRDSFSLAKYVDSIHIKKRKDKEQLYLNLSKNTSNLNVEFFSNMTYPLETNKEVKIDPNVRNDSLIIESDLIPYQFMDKKFRRILKVISFGKYSFNLINNESKYFRVMKPYISSINISISFLNNPNYLKNLLKDQINITLNFRKK